MNAPCRSRLAAALAVALLLFASCSPSSPPGNADCPSIEVRFSPDGGATDAIVREIGSARSEVLVQAYSFTSAPIAKALLSAHKRGLKVRVVLDRSQRTQQYSEADFLHNAGIPTRIDARHAIAHNKIMILDRATVITGSFNFTKAAESRNAENLLVIRNAPRLTGRYLANFDAHHDHSEEYEGRR